MGGTLLSRMLMEARSLYFCWCVLVISLIVGIFGAIGDILR
jgi:hypothetical protein